MANSNGDSLARQSRTRGVTRPHYTRHSKPPFSFVELITIAIESSLTKMLTLREITDYLERTFVCFQGDYTGWKNSVRHNLSASGRFDKVLRDFRRPFGKDNFWAVKPNSKLDIKKMQARLVSYLAKDAASSTKTGTKHISYFESLKNNSTTALQSCRVPTQGRSAAELNRHQKIQTQSAPPSISETTGCQRQSGEALHGDQSYGQYRHMQQWYPNYFYHTTPSSQNQQDFYTPANHQTHCQFEQSATSPNHITAYSDSACPDDGGVQNRFANDARDQEAPSGLSTELTDHYDENFYSFAEDSKHFQSKMPSSQPDQKPQWTHFRSGDQSSEINAPIYDRVTECTCSYNHTNSIVNAKTGDYQSVHDVLDEMSAMVDDTSLDSLAAIAMARYF
ncbi:forkhead box protein H1-like [Ptychodera flava]|uniref:forkhead box protein H1-like n=1 Tax=Ptychodera flava TaxID=63121 RepID=UPI00396A6EFA